MDISQKDLETIKKRISETIAAVAQEQVELDSILAFLMTLNDDSFEQISRSASNSLSKRKKNAGDAKTREEKIQEYEEKRVAKEQAIGRMWEKLHDLQQQERDLAGEIGG